MKTTNKDYNNLQEVFECCKKNIRRILNKVFKIRLNHFDCRQSYKEKLLKQLFNKRKTKFKDSS